MSGPRAHSRPPARLFVSLRRDGWPGRGQLCANANYFALRTELSTNKWADSWPLHHFALHLVSRVEFASRQAPGGQKSAEGEGERLNASWRICFRCANSFGQFRPAPPFDLQARVRARNSNSPRPPARSRPPPSTSPRNRHWRPQRGLRDDARGQIIGRIKGNQVGLDHQPDAAPNRRRQLSSARRRPNRRRRQLVGVLLGRRDN